MRSTKKKTAAQLNRDIAQVLAKKKPRQHAAVKAAKDVTFTDLIRSEQGGAMDAAEDFLLERGWKLREVTGALRARNFTIDMKPLYGPASQWKMVQVSVYPAGKAFPGAYTAEYKVANGSVRYDRDETMQYADADENRKHAVATAWAIARAIKDLPLSASKQTVRDLADEAIADGGDNMRNEELF